jgi:hypothetical protein
MVTFTDAIIGTGVSRRDTQTVAAGKVGLDSSSVECSKESWRSSWSRLRLRRLLILKRVSLRR